MIQMNTLFISDMILSLMERLGIGNEVLVSFLKVIILLALIILAMKKM